MIPSFLTDLSNSALISRRRPFFEMAVSHLAGSGEMDKIRENIHRLQGYRFVFRRGVECILSRNAWQI